VEITLALREDAEPDGHADLLHISLNPYMARLQGDGPGRSGKARTQKTPALGRRPAARRRLDHIARRDFRQHHMAVVGADHHTVDPLGHHPTDRGRDIPDHIRKVAPGTPGTEVLCHGVRVLGAHHEELRFLQVRGGLLR